MVLLVEKPLSMLLDDLRVTALVALDYVPFSLTFSMVCLNADYWTRLKSDE